MNHAAHPVTLEVDDLPRLTARRRLRYAVAALALPATIIGGPGLGTAAAGLADVHCLWAGDEYEQSSVVIAGGWGFTCESDAGAPGWRRGLATSRQSTVRTPGATTNPLGVFSAGAQQPGTSYVDRCVGGQLVEGRDDLHEVFSDGNGGLIWRPVGSISAWTFDPGSTPAPPSWREASLCIDGVLT